MTVIDMTNPMNRRRVMLLQFKGRLHLEMQGLKFRGQQSTMSMLNQQEGTNFRRKLEAYKYVVAELERMDAS